MTRVLVTGDREWGKGANAFYDRMLLHQTLDEAVAYWGLDSLVEGCARGADRLAEEWAALHGIIQTDDDHFPAEWDKYRPLPGQKNPAGPIRNRQMLKEGKPDLVLAFHRSLNTSKGTADMVKIARAAGIPTFVFPTYANE